MSLLLDALKKAAQQKAEKSRQEEALTASPSDEAVLAPAAEETTVLEADAGNNMQQSQRDAEDETELDTSQFQARLERTQIEREDSDDTELEIPDTAQTQAPSLSAQMQTGEDETIVFDAVDVSDFLGEPELVRRETKNHDDPTDLDQTEYQAYHSAVEAEGASDATEIDQTEHQTYHSAVEAEGTGDATEIDQTEHQTYHAVVEAEGSGDITDVQHDALQDEDMSLLLVDHDDTNLTDPHTPQGIAQVLASDDTAMDELALVDTTQHRIPDDITDTAAPAQTSTASTTGIAPETQITQGATTRVDSTSTCMDSTSTRTYAPDNYDRTLMKLPSDDESKIFAGMKSDSDVVMTPDYAKKVFRSKSSAQRMQVYKVYTGIAVVVLLSIGIYGIFEFLEQSDSIDSSLRPLKRDPMRGIIKPEVLSQDTNLFTGSGVNARTIEIIENADNSDEIIAADEGVIIDEGVVADEGVIADETAATDEVAMVENTAEVDSSPVVAESVVPAQAGSVATTPVASTIQEEAAAAEAESSSSTLEIISSSQVRQKDLWLREAYNAYQSGDYNRAMKLYNQVIEVDPGNRNALLARAAINVQNNSSTAAIKDYQALLLRNPKDSLAMTSLITVANLSPRKTESQLKLMLRDEPDSPYLNFALANAYGAQNRWQEAQGYYFKALENNPQDPNYAYNLAVSLEHIAQPLAAVSYYQRALANINNSLATFNREIVSQRVETLAKQ